MRELDIKYRFTCPAPTQRSLMLLEIVIGSEWMLFPLAFVSPLKAELQVKKCEKINLLINIRIYFMFCSPHFLPHSTLPVFTQSVFMSSASTVWWSCRRMNEKRQQQRASLKMWVKLKIIVWNSAFCASTATDEHGNCRDKKKLKKHIHNGIH